MDIVLANSAYPDEISHSAAFHLGLHCLSKLQFRGFWTTKGLKGFFGVYEKVLTIYGLYAPSSCYCNMYDVYLFDLLFIKFL